MGKELYPNANRGSTGGGSNLPNPPVDDGTYDLLVQGGAASWSPVGTTNTFDTIVVHQWGLFGDQVPSPGGPVPVATPTSGTIRMGEGLANIKTARTIGGVVVTRSVLDVQNSYVFQGTSQDSILLGSEGVRIIALGDTSVAGNLTIGEYAASSPPSNGVIRIPNDTFIFARNSSNTGDQRVIGFDNSNTILLGDDFSTTYVAGNLSVNGSFTATSLTVNTLTVNSSATLAATTIGRVDQAPSSPLTVNGPVRFNYGGAPQLVIAGDATDAVPGVGAIALSRGSAIAGIWAMAEDLVTQYPVLQKVAGTESWRIGSSSIAIVAIKYIDDGSGYLQVGTSNGAIQFTGLAATPTTGNLRVPNATSIVVFRNASNTADVVALATDASNNLTLGASGVTRVKAVSGTAVQMNPVVEIGASGATFATAGAVRLSAAASQAGIVGRVNAGTSDMTLLATDASDNLTLGNATNAVRVKIASATAVQIAMATPALELGTGTVASAGALRFANASTGAAFRNAANTANVTVWASDASNNLTVGDAANAARVKLAATTAVQIAMTTPVLEIGSGTVASAGTVRMGNATNITARNAANTADITVAATDASNNVVTGDATNTARNLLRAATAVQIAMTTPVLEIGSGTVAAAGTIRMGNAANITARNAANTADITVTATDASNNVITGDASNTARNLLRAATAVQIAMASPVLEIGSGTVASTGVIRMGNSQYIVGRTSGGSNVQLIGVWSSDRTLVGDPGLGTIMQGPSVVLDTGTYFAFDPTATLAASGLIRIGNQTSIVLGMRNAANTADVAVLATDTSNNVYVGMTSAGASQAVTAVVNGSTSVNVRVSNTNKLAVATNVTVAGSAALILQTTSTTNAATGEIRTSNASTIVAARNAANTADISVAATDASNNVIVGDVTTPPRVLLRAATAVQVAMSTPVLEIGTTNLSGTGDVRFGAATARTIVGIRNAGNTADIALVAADASNNIYFGATSGAGSQAPLTYLTASNTGKVQIGVNNTVQFQAQASLAQTGAPLQVNVNITTPNASSVGDLQFTLASARTLLGLRNNGNTADIAVLATSASNVLFIGSTSANTLGPSGGIVIGTSTASVAFFNGTPATKQSVTGALSTVADAAAKAVLTSIISALSSYSFVTNSTT